MIKRIVFMCDVLRVGQQVEFVTDRFFGAFYFLFKEQVRIATGIEPERVLAKDKKIFNRDRFYQLSGYESASEKNWVKIVSGNFTQKSIAYFSDCFHDCLIIVQEAGALKSVIEKAEIPFIDMYISPFRFMEDLHFAMRTNIDIMREKILNYKLSEDNIFIEANKVKAFYWARCNASNKGLRLRKNSLLVCGQSSTDLSLIKNGKIVTFGDYKNDLVDIFNSYNFVYYKHHPMNKDNKNEEFLNSIHKLKTIENNIYELMSSENIVGVAALSSGTLKEAYYFGKKVHTISHQYVDLAGEKNKLQPDNFIVIDDAYYSPNFWADILSPIIQTKKSRDFNYVDKANLLRSTFGVSWGYEISHEYELIKKMDIKNDEEIQNKNIFKLLMRKFFCL